MIFRNKYKDIFIDQTSRNTATNIIVGVLAAITFNLIHPYFSKYIQRLGGDEIHIAYLSSIPYFVSIFSLIPGAILIDSLGMKHKFTALSLLIARFFYLPMAALPLLPIENNLKPLIFVILVGLQNLPGSIFNLGYQSCIADVFDPRDRGHSMALKNKFSDATKMIVTFLSGIVMTIPKSPEHIIFLYQIFFVLATFFGIMEFIAFSKLEFIKLDTSANKIGKLSTLKKALIFTFTDKKYRLFLICSLMFYIGWQIGWPLFSIYMIKNLEATEGWIAATTIAGGLAAIFTATGWMAFAHKYGNTKAIVIALFCMSVTPFLYVFTTHLWQLIIFNIIIGFSITGTTLLFFNIMLDITNNEYRTTIISIFQTITAITATITPIIGVGISTAHGIKIALIVTGILRLMGSISFIYYHFKMKKLQDK